MSVGTSVLHRSVKKVANMKDPEEELVAEDSPIRGLPTWSMCEADNGGYMLLPFKCCAT
jgi:hypothetical protein